MAVQLKFLHSSDWHLDQPISGLTEIPSHLKKSLADAPWRAAEAFFSLALAERVDFVLLAGDLVDLERGGPRAAAFLLGQFERLREKRIGVFWCGGSVDHPDRWPAAIELPDNVVIFPSSLAEQSTWTRNGKPVARVLGAGFDPHKRSASDFRCEPDSPFSIVLIHGELDTAAIATQGIRYWALGGRHKRAVMDKTSTMAVYPGTPQGRNPAETGSHSCTLVTVDDAGRIKASEMELDPVRWSSQKLSIAENASIDDMKSVMAERCGRLRNEFPGGLTLVRWKFETHGPFNPRLRSGRNQTDLLAWARLEFGQSQNGLWTTKIVIDPPASLPAEWHEEDTILGDYLRATGRYLADPAVALVLPAPRAADNDDDDEKTVADFGRIDPSEREEILGQATLTGIEYLARGELLENA